MKHMCIHEAHVYSCSTSYSPMCIRTRISKIALDTYPHIFVVIDVFVAELLRPTATTAIMKLRLVRSWIRGFGGWGEVK
jgi:hypothetical protein